MLDSFNSLLKLLRFRRIHIDGYVFRLHCILTVIILMAFIVINSTKQIVGDPIVCTRDKDIEEKDVINNWCYIKGIHSNIKSTHGHITGIYTGLGQPQDQYHYKPNVFYQWVWFMLLIQGICFYFPRWLWKGFEGGKITLFTSNLDYFSLKDEKNKKIDIIVDYLYRTNGYNDWYAIKYFFCELLALVNVIFQMAINDIFLSGQYSTYGINWINYMTYSPKINVDPMDTVFPIQSKCYLNRFGLTGNTENLDFLCILSINIFNQKIYLFCWFWFIFLAIALTFVILFRVILICCPLIRYYCCRFRFELSDKSRKHSRKLVINKLRIGDWFLLYLLGQNIEPIIFCEIIENLSEKLQIDTNSSNDQNVYHIQDVTHM